MGEDFEVVPFEEVPSLCRTAIRHQEIRRAAQKLLSIGPGRAIRLKLNGESASHACKKAHVFYRRRPFKMRTRHVDGYLYMWIEPKEPPRFEVAAVPIKAKAQSA